MLKFNAKSIKYNIIFHLNLISTGDLPPTFEIQICRYNLIIKDKMIFPNLVFR